MKTTLTFAAILMLTATMAVAQVTIPDGTKIRVRLEQNLSSETAVLGQTVDFAVTQEVRVGDAIVIANGARATGSIVQAEQRRRLGRAGHLDFTIDRVQMVDGHWLNVRYTPQKNAGKGSGVKSGIITAGIAVVFWPAAPLGLLVKGKDATIIKGRTYEVFSDDSVYVATAVAASTPLVTRALPQAYTTIVRQPGGQSANNANLPNSINAGSNPVLVNNSSMISGDSMNPQAGAMQASLGSAATLSINADQPGAEIEVDGAFVGNAPTTIQLPAGMHQITVRGGSGVWQRDIQITGGTVSINATLGRATLARTSR